MLPIGYIEISRSAGISLRGINPQSDEVAFPREAALSALAQLDKTSIAILGGDVLKEDGDKLEYVYANWSCDKGVNEDLDSYAERSRDEARRYVKNFRPAYKFEPLFVFVIISSSNIADSDDSRRKAEK